MIQYEPRQIVILDIFIHRRMYRIRAEVTDALPDGSYRVLIGSHENGNRVLARAEQLSEVRAHGKLVFNTEAQEQPI